MKISKRFIYILAIVIFFLGCGGSNNSSTNNYKPNTAYIGKTEQAILTQENLILFAQAVHYIEKLDIDVDMDPDYSNDTRKVKNYLNDNGIGYLNFFYTNYQECCTKNIINGTVQLNILSLNKYTGAAKIKSIMDLTLTTDDNNISLHANLSGTINNSQSESYTINEYQIFDQKRDLQIEVKDITSNININGNEVITGKLYIGSAGYVKFKNTGTDYKLFDIQGRELDLSYKDNEKIEIMFNKIKKDDLYYSKHKISYYQFPKVLNARIILNNEYNDTNLTIKYKLEEDLATQISAIWYVNDKKIDAVSDTVLSRKHFKVDDKIEVKLIVKNKDALASEYIQGYTVPRKPPVVNFHSDIQNFNKLSSSIIIKTNELKFKFDNFDMFSADGKPMQITWSVSDYNKDDIEIISNTKNKIHPTLQIKEHGNYNLRANITWGENGNSGALSESIMLDIRPNMFDVSVYDYTDDPDINVDNLKVIDVNNDGLKDIILLTGKNHMHETKIILFHQQEDGSFIKKQSINVKEGYYKYIVSRSLVVKDFNNDGFVDFATDYYTNDTRFGAYKAGVAIYYQTNDNNFSNANLHTASKYTTNKIVSMNFNSDNLIDLIVLAGHINTSGADLRLEFMLQNKNGYSSHIDIIDENFPEDSQIFLGNFNGDSKQNILIASTSSYLAPHDKPQIITFLQTTQNIERKHYNLKNYISEDKINLNSLSTVDFNNDGYDDVLFSGIQDTYDDKDKNIYIMYSQGSNGLLEEPVRLSTNLHVKIARNNNALLSGDINGDGNKDIFVFHDKILSVLVSNNGEYKTYLRSMALENNRNFFNLFQNQMVVTDLNNDGKDDVIFAADENRLKIGISKF